MQGSNDGANWHTLTDASGSAIEFSSGGIAAVTEPTIFVRPKITAGTGVTVSMTFAALTRA